MPTVKRVFSIPDDISDQLNTVVPNQQRSKFVTQTLAEALQKRNREKLLKALDELEPWQLDDTQDARSVVEIIREIRQTETQKLADNFTVHG